jgi:hypothetical protein
MTRGSCALVSSIAFLAACSSSPSGGGKPTSDAGHDAALGGSGGGAGTDASSGGTAGSAGASGTGGTSTGGAAGSGGATSCVPNAGVSQADCQGLCEHVASASCPDDPPLATCTADCKSVTDNYAKACETEVVALVNCEKNATLSCGASGSYEAPGCEGPNQDYLACTACLPLAGDACSCCETQYCCTERKALFTDPNLNAFIGCRDTCGFDPGCWEQVCDAQYPATSTKFYDVIFCTDGLCHDECSPG